jgi:hypothetical protein
MAIKMMFSSSALDAGSEHPAQHSEALIIARTVRFIRAHYQQCSEAKSS